jgi:DNA repair exonuclease SbcCD ATPase subunit
MSDARLVKLLSAKIEELEAELAAARMENVAIYGTSHHEIYKTAEDEVKERRAELSAAKDAYKTMLAQAESDLDKARAELAAEREGRQDAIKQIATARDERDAIQQKADDEFASMSEQLNTFVCERVKIMAERDALRSELAAEREWRPMATAPTDGTLILAAVRVYAAGTKRFLYWDIQAVLLDEGLALTSCGDDCGWHWEDFEVWKPIALDGIDAALKGGEN